MATYRLPFGYLDWPAEPPVEPERADFDAEPGPSARLHFRLPAALKSKIEASAALEGVPPDVWVERALSRSLDPRLSGV
jgi:hypothetical protein